MFYDFFANRHKAGRPTAIGSWNVRRRMTEQLRILAETGALEGSCLEIGPGDGVFAEYCRDAGLAYRAIERSPAFHQSLVERGFDAELGSAPPIEHGAAQFDIVCLLAVLEHMPTFEQALQLLSECHRVMKPKGRLVISVPDYLRGGIGFFAWDYTHSLIMTDLRVEQILGDTGFEVERRRFFTGGFSNPLVRWPVDLAAFLVHSRLVYWLTTSVGLQSLLFKFHKTLQPSIFVTARKVG